MDYSSLVFLLIPIVALVAWGVQRAIKASYEGKARVAEAGDGENKLALALDDNAAINRQVLAKLERMETRLATVEKTLTDIPA